MSFRFCKQSEHRERVNSGIASLVIGVLLLFACDHLIGAENEADSRITFSIAEQISISQLQDFDFNYDPAVNGTSGPWRQTKDFCVYRSGNGGAYDIYFNGDDGTGSTGDGAAFAVGNGSNPVIPYDVLYNYDGSGSTPLLMQPGSSNQAWGVGDDTDKNCGSQRAQLSIEFDTGRLAQSHEGTYRGTLYVTVSPR